LLFSTTLPLQWIISDAGQFQSSCHGSEQTLTLVFYSFAFLISSQEIGQAVDGTKRKLTPRVFWGYTNNRDWLKLNQVQEYTLNNLAGNKVPRRKKKKKYRGGTQDRNRELTRISNTLAATGGQYSARSFILGRPVHIFVYSNALPRT
jgi:hypothetical protein